MNNFTLPSWWDRGSFVAKAAWLKQSGRARTFEEACSMLAKRRGRPKAVTQASAVARLPYKDE